MMFSLPEFTLFIEKLGLHRLYMWMKPYGHALAKPTILFGNLDMSRLLKKWSRRIQKAIMARAAKKNSKLPWLRKLVKSGVAFRTAFRFWDVRSAQIEKMIHYTKTWNSNKHKLDVNGGRYLKDSGAYTRGFSRAVLQLFVTTEAMSSPPVAYAKIWHAMKFRWQFLVRRVRNLEEDWLLFLIFSLEPPQWS